METRPKKLILIRGLPGSGKSTLAAEIAWDSDFIHREADMFWYKNGEYNFDANRLAQAHEWCRNETIAALEMDCDVVVSNTFTTIKELDPYFEIAHSFGIVPTVITCQNQFKNIHSVPEATMAKMKARFVWDISALFDKYSQPVLVDACNLHTA